MAKPIPPMQPRRDTAHVRLTCVDCQLETAVAVPLHQQHWERKCGHCGSDLLRVLWVEREAPHPPSHLRGEPLRRAVKSTFKKERATM